MSDVNATHLTHEYLHDHPHITVVSDVFYSRLKVGNKISPYRSGERYVYVTADYAPSLPENTQIGNYNVRVWHRSQDTYCKRCNTADDHKTAETSKCGNYKPDLGLVRAFREDWDILSNYFYV